MDLTSNANKIRVYTNGLVVDGVGAYAYIVLESPNLGVVDFGPGKGRVFAPGILRAKFAQGGKATEASRMKMRAVYEGVRHCPDHTTVEVYTDDFLIDSAMQTAVGNMADADIATRYRDYVAQHGITVQYVITKYYNGSDLPCNDHDEWTWWAHHLCEYEIRKLNPKRHAKDNHSDDADSGDDELFPPRQ